MERMIELDNGVRIVVNIDDNKLEIRNNGDLYYSLDVKLNNNKSITVVLDDKDKLIVKSTNNYEDNSNLELWDEYTREFFTIVV